MAIESYLTGLASGLTVEALKRLGIQWKGSAQRFKERPHWRVGRWPEIGRQVFGRGELTGTVADQLGNRRTVAIVKGMGGVGKTTVARHYVERYGHRFDGVLWVQAESESTLVNDLNLLAVSVKVPNFEQIEDAAARAQACLDAVSASDRDWLIVFDNAPNEAALSKWSVKGARVRTLATSRSTQWSPAFRKIPADVLNTGTSGDPGPQLLMREAGERDHPEAARALAEDLGGLPLALVAAGGLIQDRGGGFGAYREKLDAVLKEVPAGDYPDSVIGAVKLSYDALDADARAVLDLFAWYAPEGLDAALLTDLPNAPPLEAVKYDIGGDLLSLCADPERAKAAATALVRRSLLARDGEGFTLHRMSAAAVQALQVPAGRRDAAARQAAAVLAAAYPGGDKSPQDFENWPACARLTPHVLALHRAWPLGEADRLQSAAAEYLFNQATLYLVELAEARDAVRLATSGLELVQARRLESAREIVVAWSTLGRAKLAAGDFSGAIEAQSENLRLCMRYCHGGEDTAIAHNNHAMALAASGRHTNSRPQLEQAKEEDFRALSLRCRHFGRVSEPVAQSLSNVARDHEGLDELEKALRLSQLALRIHRRRVAKGDMPPQDHKLGFTLHNTGSFHLRHGQADAARPLLTEALDLRRNAYRRDEGRDHHPYVKKTASWLVSCHLVLAQRDPGHEAEARQIAEAFGLDWEEAQAKAAQHPGPVDIEADDAGPEVG